MTENKRFIYAKSEGGVGYAIYDTTKTYTFPNLPREYEAKVLCRVLNEFVDENEKLKKRISDLQKENYGNIDGVAFYQEENASLCEKIFDLEFENEELLKDIDRLVEVTSLGIDDIIYKYTEDV